MMAAYLFFRRYISTTTTSTKLGNFLIIASIAKALSGTGGTRNLDGDSIPLSESLVLQVLRRNSIDISKKLSFFQWCSLRPNYKHSANAYSQIFRSVCLHCHKNQQQQQLLEDILNLLSFMKQDGVVLDSATYKLLLDAFIRCGKFNSALKILDYYENDLKLKTTTGHLNLDIYNSVLVALVRNDQLDLALTIFFKLFDASNVNITDIGHGNNDNHNVFPSAFACNELFVALRKAEMKVKFREVFDKLRKKYNSLLDTWGYNICIHAFGCWGDLAMSLRLFKEMKEKSLDSCSSCGPDLCTYNSLLHVLCSAGKVKDALLVWEELKGSGHEPDAFSYRILIQGCSKSYLIDDATKILNEMQYNGLCPDTVVYNSLLDGFLKARKLTEACHLYEKMIDEGVRASCWTHNILIDGLFKNGRGEAAYTLFSDLKKKGQFVDGITYSIVIMHVSRDGQLEEALELVKEMEVRGFLVDLVTITSLLIALYKHDRWDWTDRLMKHVRGGNLMPAILKWNANMESSVKGLQSREKDYTPIFPSKGKFSDILQFVGSADGEIDLNLGLEGNDQNDNETSIVDVDPWSSSPYMDMLAEQVASRKHLSSLFFLSRAKRVEEKGIDSFDIDMVNTYLSIFLAKGKLSLACKLFEIFSDMGVNPVSYTYNSLLSSFVKKGYFNEAWGVLQEMDEKVCHADIATYNMIIQGLGKLGRADLANAVLEKLLKQGGYLDIVMYNTLINALGKAGRIDEASKLFEQMKGSGINPDVVTYNTLIEVHSKAGRLKDAYKYLKMMLDAGCPPNHVTDTTLDYLEKEIEKVRYQKASMRRTDTGDLS